MRCCSTLTICLAGVVVWATIEAGISLAEAQSQDCTVELCPPLPPPLPLLQPPGAAATGGLAAVRATEVSLAAVQAQNQNIRDAIQRRASTGATGRPVVAAEPAEDPTDWPWQALAYRTRDAKSPITKAPAMPTAPSYQFATWGQLFGDRETRSGNINGIDIGRRTNTGGGLGGAYLTAPGVSSGDVWVIGLLGGGTAADTRNNDGTTARVDGPGFGAHMSAFGSKADISKSTIRGRSISADAIQQLLRILLAEAMAQTAREPAKHSAAASRQSNRGSIQSGQNTFVRRWSISCAMK